MQSQTEQKNICSIDNLFSISPATLFQPIRWHVWTNTVQTIGHIHLLATNNGTFVLQSKAGRRCLMRRLWQETALGGRNSINKSLNSGALPDTMALTPDERINMEFQACPQAPIQPKIIQTCCHTQCASRWSCYSQHTKKQSFCLIESFGFNLP